MLQFSRVKILLISLVCVLGAIYAAPTFVPAERLGFVPTWINLRAVNLGLDLRGGSHLLLEVDMKAVRQERIDNLLEAVRAQLRTSRLGFTNLGVSGDAVVMKLRDPADRDRAQTLMREVDRESTTLTISPQGDVVMQLTPQAIEARRAAALQQSLEIVRRRIDETGTKEANIVRHGSDRILVQLPGVDDPERIKALLGKTAKLTFRMLDPRASMEDVQAGRAPAGSEILHQEGPRGEGRGTSYAVQRRVLVAGENLTDAQATFQNGEPVVSFRFDSIGARRFGEATSENVGKLFAIVLDNKVISAPVIREPILGGTGVITGGFNVQGAQDLALLLRAGALPAPLNVIEERTVGPELGSDSIRAGAIACLIGYVLIAVLMIVGYGLFGIIANIALALNLAFTLAIMALLGGTLTLPGLAGMVLGLAMAVDANVLIYERMREEIRQGRSPFPVVDVAFQKAYGTILDSNLTTLIASLLLFGFGSGPVKGFAVTLSIGISTSMFTAVTVTRMLCVGYLYWRRPRQLPI